MQKASVSWRAGPETIGRKTASAASNEILTLNQEIEDTQLVVDWARLHALHQGTLKKTEDFRAIAEKIEQKLGTEAMRSMHCHFSKIEFTDQGEKRHHTLDEEKYGPRLSNVSRSNRRLPNAPDNDMRITNSRRWRQENEGNSKASSGKQTIKN